MSDSNTWLEPLVKYIIAPGLAIIGPLLVAGLAKLVQYLDAKAKESKAARVAGVFVELARSVVAEVEVTLRPEIQKALSDGKLTKEEGALLKAKALEILKTKAPSGLLQAAQSIFGPILDTWLGGLVERANTENSAAQNPLPA